MSDDSGSSVPATREDVAMMAITIMEMIAAHFAAYTNTDPDKFLDRQSEAFATQEVATQMVRRLLSGEGAHIG